MIKMTKKGRTILFYSRRLRYGFLSNMYLCRIRIDGQIYKSVEHYYQSRKAMRSEVRGWICAAPIAYFAFSAGRALRKKDMVGGWQKKRLMVMKKALYAKFTQNKDLKEKLLKTGDAVLHEDSPTDMFWGMRGKDNLGKMLMKLRSQLLKEGLN